MIYFVEPTVESISRVCADFADPQTPMYGEVHLFFTRHVGDAELLPIQRCKALLSRVLTLTEVRHLAAPPVCPPPPRAARRSQASAAPGSWLER